MRTERPAIRRRPRGVGLVELLIALAISASLLTVVAVATDASFKAYAVNEEQSGLTQRARLAMHRILTYVRTSKEHQPLATAAVNDFNTGRVATDTGLSMFTEDGKQLDFEFDAAGRKLLAIEDGKSRVMLNGVEAFRITFEPMQSATAIKTGGGFDLLRRVTILLTIRTTGQHADIDESADGQTVTLSASVMPRRNIW